VLTFGLFVRHCLPLTLMEYAGRYLYSHADSKVPASLQVESTTV